MNQKREPLDSSSQSIYIKEQNEIIREEVKDFYYFSDFYDDEDYQYLIKRLHGVQKEVQGITKPLPILNQVMEKIKSDSQLDIILNEQYHVFKFKDMINNQMYSRSLVEYILIIYCQGRLNKRSRKQLFDVFNNLFILQLMNGTVIPYKFQEIIEQKQDQILNQNVSGEFDLILDSLVQILLNDSKFNVVEHNWTHIVQCIFSQIEVPYFIFLLENINENDTKIERISFNNKGAIDYYIIMIADDIKQEIYFFNSLPSINVKSYEQIYQTPQQINYHPEKILKVYNQKYYYTECWVETILYKLLFQIGQIAEKFYDSKQNDSYQNILKIVNQIDKKKHQLLEKRQRFQFELITHKDLSTFESFSNCIKNGKYSFQNFVNESQSLIKIFKAYLIVFSQIEKKMYQHNINYQLAKDICSIIQSEFQVQIDIRLLLLRKKLNENISSNLRVFFYYDDQKILFLQGIEIDDEIKNYNELYIIPDRTKLLKKIEEQIQFANNQNIQQQNYLSKYIILFSNVFKKNSLSVELQNYDQQQIQVQISETIQEETIGQESKIQSVPDYNQYRKINNNQNYEQNQLLKDYNTQTEYETPTPYEDEDSVQNIQNYQLQIQNKQQLSKPPFNQVYQQINQQNNQFEQNKNQYPLTQYRNQQSNQLNKNNNYKIFNQTQQNFPNQSEDKFQQQINQQQVGVTYYSQQYNNTQDNYNQQFNFQNHQISNQLNTPNIQSQNYLYNNNSQQNNQIINQHLNQQQNLLQNQTNNGYYIQDNNQLNLQNNSNNLNYQLVIHQSTQNSSSQSNQINYNFYSQQFQLKNETTNSNNYEQDQQYNNQLNLQNNNYQNNQDLKYSITHNPQFQNHTDNQNNLYNQSQQNNNMIYQNNNQLQSQSTNQTLSYSPQKTKDINSISYQYLSSSKQHLNMEEENTQTQNPNQFEEMKHQQCLICKTRSRDVFIVEEMICSICFYLKAIDYA